MEVLPNALKFIILSCLLFDCTVSENDYGTSESPITANASEELADECGEDEACVRFCCNDSRECPEILLFNKSSIPEAKDLDDNFRILNGLPACYHTSKAYLHDSTWMFLKNGSIKTDPGEGDFLETPDRYCYGYNGTELLICHIDDENGQSSHQGTNFFPYLMLISVPFCVVTFFVYLCIAELRNLHGKCLMGYLFGMTSLFLTFPVVGLNQDFIASLSGFCELTGYIAYVSILFCFFWLNVMCYDIYSTFRSIQGSSSIRRTWGIRNIDNQRFICYCLYAFGVPCLISTIVFLIDRYVDDENILKVGMGQNRCWIKPDRTVEALYVYIPMTVLLLLNLKFYLITLYKIHKVQKQTSRVMQADKNSHHSRINVEKTRFFLYLRLFVIMGVPWIFETMSWYWEGSYFSMAADVLNSLQGIMIFLLFVWKPKIRKAVAKKFCASGNVTKEPVTGRKWSRTDTSTSLRFDSAKYSHSTCDSSIVFTEVDLAGK